LKQLAAIKFLYTPNRARVATSPVF